MVKRGFEVYYSSNPGYGACDIPLEEMEAVNADLVLHLGHPRYYSVHAGEHLRGRVLYIPVYYLGTPSSQLLEELVAMLNRLGARRISISSTLVERYVREYVSSFLESRGFIVRTVEEPVLGCSYGHVKVLDELVDAHLIIAGGVFHPLGLALATSKPVVALDPYLGKVWYTRHEAEKVLRKRLYILFKAKSATRGLMGLIIGVRPGQLRLNLVDYIEELAVSKGYKIYKLVSNYLTLERLAAIDAALDLDFYVVTSCPRLPVDDLAEFHKPVLTPGEFIMLVTGSTRYSFPW